MNLLSMIGGPKAMAKMAASYIPDLEKFLIDYAKSVEFTGDEARLQLLITHSPDRERIVAFISVVDQSGKPLRHLHHGELSVIISELLKGASNDGDARE
jgi:hypothetical protein